MTPNSKVCVSFILAALFAAVAAAEEPQHCADIADSAARLACYDAQAKPAPAEPSQPEARKAEEPTDISSVEGHIAGAFKGWHKGTLFMLDNGQAWKVDGDDVAYHSEIPDNPKVAIARGYLGGYWMTIEGVDRKVKVRRVLELRKKP